MHSLNSITIVFFSQLVLHFKSSAGYVFLIESKKQSCLALLDWIVTLFNCIIEVQKLLLVYELCNNCRPLGLACGKCDTFKGRTDKVKGRLALVKLKARTSLKI